MTRKHNLSVLSRVAAGAVILMLAACSTESTSEPIPLSALNGVWSPTRPEVPGLSYEFSLALNGDALSGTGQWAVGSQSGTVTVTGSLSGETVTLDLTLGHEQSGTLPFLIEHFSGGLKSATTLSGTFTASSGSGTQSYTKIGG